MLELTGADDVQFLVHCFGATAWTIALLGGFLDPAKVRSTVVSQVSTDMVVPLATKIKSGLHVPTFLQAIGVESLTPDVDEDKNAARDVFPYIVEHLDKTARVVE